MNRRIQTAEGSADFDRLTPDAVIALAERALGARCSNVCRPLNSYINRVYEVQRADGTPAIAKFYRPGRWSAAGLQDEHDFLRELAEEEIPVVAPLVGADGRTLHSEGEMRYALFPKKGGRVLDEVAPQQWVELGRLIGRVHAVGARRTPRDRVVYLPRPHAERQIRTVLESGCVPAECAAAYEREALAIVERITPLFEGVERIRLHGDAHRQNIVFRPGEGLFLIDFDDMCAAPPIQDLWMFLPGRLAECRREADALAEGYATFRELTPEAWRLVEPLRAMRMIHFAAWCARQAADGGFARLAPDFRTAAHWRNEIRELQRQRRTIEEALEGAFLL